MMLEISTSLYSRLYNILKDAALLDAKLIRECKLLRYMHSRPSIVNGIGEKKKIDKDSRCVLLSVMNTNADYPSRRNAFPVRSNVVEDYIANDVTAPEVYSEFTKEYEAIQRAADQWVLSEAVW